MSEQITVAISHPDNKDMSLSQSLMMFLINKKSKEFAIGDWLAELDGVTFGRLSQCISAYENTGVFPDDFVFVVIRSHTAETLGRSPELDAQQLFEFMHKAIYAITLEFMRREGVVHLESPIRLLDRAGENMTVDTVAVAKIIAEHKADFH